MSRRPPLSGLVLLAVAVVAAATWWRPASPSSTSDQTPSASPIPSAAPSARPRGAPSPSPVSAETEPLPPLDTAEDGLATKDLWAAIGDPANSDLPAELFAQLTRLGVDIVVADATGAGRQRWPHYWAAGQAPAGRADICCSHITIHAAGAFTDADNPGVVQVTVVWSAQTANHRLNQLSTVQFVRRDATWYPLPAH